MNVAKTNTVAQPAKLEAAANDQRAKETQQQRQQAQTAAQETQKVREQRPEVTAGGEINITV